MRAACPVVSSNVVFFQKSYEKSPKPFDFGALLVDDIGLDLHFALWAKLWFGSVEPSPAALRARRIQMGSRPIYFCSFDIFTYILSS